MLTKPAPPLIKMLARQIVPPRHIRDAGAVNSDLGQNAQLLLVRPAPTRSTPIRISCRIITSQATSITTSLTTGSYQ